MKYCNAFFKTGLWWIKKLITSVIVPLSIIYIIFKFLEILSTASLLQLLGYVICFLVILIAVYISYDKYMEFLEEEENGGNKMAVKEINLENVSKKVLVEMFKLMEHDASNDPEDEWTEFELFIQSDLASTDVEVYEEVLAEEFAKQLHGTMIIKALSDMEEKK